MRHLEVPQAGSPGGDRHRQIQSEEGLVTLRLPADDPDGFFQPEIRNEPPLRLSAQRQAMGWLYGQHLEVDRHLLRPAALAWPDCGTAKTSRNNFSSN